ncbi:hypothetical protein GF407_11750 [candidate division KSB1 bacterium]|nr:hypothetical protein [candidate division KSB1 bacterium]
MYNHRHINFHKPGTILRFVGWAILGVLFAAVMGLIFGFAVMWLWNWLMPALFGLPSIGFWQAWGLVILSHILFKSFPHHGSHHHDDRWKKKFHEKFMREEEEAQPRE